MRGLLGAALLLWAAAAQANPTWGSLWRTDEQRGQQLLRQGKPAEAAKLFRDPRRKAYAELLAGNFPQAAQDFAAFGDSDSQYNRGNALARAGRLQEAIKAYDTALARDPANRDARYNRDLVAKALQKQPPKPQFDSGKGQQGDKGQSGQNGQKQGDQNTGSGTQNGDASKPSSNNTAQAGKPSQSQAGGAQTQPAGQGQPQQGHPQPGQQQAGQSNPGQSPAPRNADANANASQQNQAANDAAQARNDAAAVLTKPQAGQALQAASSPPSERQLAEEQWLRRIPDDPGGLLRRKFLIEHLIRQQGTQP